jgi:protein TonB
VQAQGPRGLVRFRILVGTDGRVRDCRVTRSSGFRGLDAATCSAAIRNLRWFPATDTAGRPVEAWIPGSNEWIPRPGADRWIDPVEVRD